MLKWITCLLATLSLVVAGCSTPGPAPSQTLPADTTLRGEATLLERIELPPGTTLEVKLIDTSAPSGRQTIATTSVADPRTMPIRFEIRYAAKGILKSHRYIVHGSLVREGRTLFESSRDYPVITSDPATDPSLVLTRVITPADPGTPSMPLGTLPATYSGDLPCADCASLSMRLNLFADGTYQLRSIRLGVEAPPQDEIGRWTVANDQRGLMLNAGQDAPRRFSIEGRESLRASGVEMRGARNTGPATLLRRSPQFEPFEPRLALRGMFSVAPAGAVFAECLTGRSMPLQDGGDAKALEDAYARAQPARGAVLLATFEGRIVSRMAKEGEPPVVAVAVDRFLRLSAEESCALRLPAVPLMGTYWKLQRIGRASVTPPRDQPEPHLVLGEAGRYTGADGCAALQGGYRVEGDTLALAPDETAAATACRQSAQQAQRIGQTLRQALRYRISDRTLDLLDGSGNLLLRFEGRAAK